MDTKLNYNKLFDNFNKNIRDYIIRNYGSGGILTDYLVHLPRYKEIGEIILNFSSESSNILEIGVHHGYTCKLLEYLERNNFIGLDLDSSGCLFPELKDKIIQFDLELIPTTYLPIRDNYFDIIIFTEVFEHLHPYKVKDIMQDIKRILKPGGIIIFSTPNLAALENRISLLLGGIGKYRSGSIIATCHTREYTMKELVIFLIKEGFEIVYNSYQSPRQYIMLDSKNKFIEGNSLKGLIVNPSLKNFARLIIGGIKTIVPTFREGITLILRKPNSHVSGD